MKQEIYHFIGIGGISMSALAVIMKNNNICVQGSDLEINERVRFLKKEGIKVFKGHHAKNVKTADVVIINAAIDENNPELKTAMKTEKHILTRAELLGAVCKNYKNVIAISGAHGKTTTTEMIAETLLAANLNPTVMVGGISKYFNSNLHIGGIEYLVCEACEYKNSFLEIKPKIGVILNIEAEHLDFFKNYQNVLNSFKKFEEQSEISVKLEKDNEIYLAQSKNFRIYAKNISEINSGFFGFDCFNNEESLGRIELNIPGKHNVLNALACAAVSFECGVNFETIKTSLKNYKGVKRRFEVLCTEPNIVIHDYAHHPTEIASVLNAVKKYHSGKIFLVFQPHTYSRTKTLWNDFINIFSACDEVLFFKTYSAREKKINTASAKALYKTMKGKIKCHYKTNFKSCYKCIKNILPKDSLLLILGAGDVEHLARMFEKI